MARGASFRSSASTAKPILLASRAPLEIRSRSYVPGSPLSAIHVTYVIAMGQA